MDKSHPGFRGRQANSEWSPTTEHEVHWRETRALAFYLFIFLVVVKSTQLESGLYSSESTIPLGDMNISEGRLRVIMRKIKSSLPLLLPTEMKWKVQLSRGSMVSTMEAVREREREGTSQKRTTVKATALQYLEKAAQDKCTMWSVNKLKLPSPASCLRFPRSFLPRPILRNPSKSACKSTAQPHVCETARTSPM